MMFANKLAFAVKVGGKVLREHDDTTYLPFGSQYSLLIKNMNSQRALVHIEIDGESIGADFIVDANSSIDIERFVKSGNLKAGNKFKFIERTSAIEDGPRGVKLEDGLIRVEFEFERAYAKLEYPHSPTWYQVSPWKGTASDQLARGPELMGYYNPTSSTGAVAQNSVGGSPFRSMPVNNAGITAPGEISNQTFHTATFGLSDGVKHVMVMKLLGQVGEKVVAQPVTVKHKPTCVTCGKVNRATNKCCAECGTSLSIV